MVRKIRVLILRYLPGPLFQLWMLYKARKFQRQVQEIAGRLEWENGNGR